jgi:hypothetical protein
VSLVEALPKLNSYITNKQIFRAQTNKSIAKISQESTKTTHVLLTTSAKGHVLFPPCAAA